MTNGEKYRQAFSVLHASEHITLENITDREKAFRPPMKFMSICICTVIILALSAAAYAYRDVIINRIIGWGNNFEIAQGIDSDGVSTSVSILHTEKLTEPVFISDGKMIFIVNNENIDITDRITQSEAFRYEYTDEEGNTHFWLVGLNSDEPENYGYAEYIKDPEGMWAGGYSARVNIEADGSTSAHWLETGKSELNIPW